MEKGLALAAELGVANVMALLMARATVRGYSGDPRCVSDSREVPRFGFRLGLGRTTAVAMNNYADALFYFDRHELRGMRGGKGRNSHASAALRGEMWTTAESLRALLHLGEWDELQVRADEVLRWAAEHGGGQARSFHTCT